MPRMTIFGLVVLAALGCGRSKPPPPKVEAPLQAQGPSPAIGDPTVEPVEPVPVGPVFEGRSPRQWDKMLDSPNPAVRSQAVAALVKLGKAAAPQLMARLENGTEEVRLDCLSAMGKAELIDNPQKTMSLLFAMLDAQNPSLRQAAASRLAWFGEDGAKALPYLEHIAQKDPEPEVRRVAKASIDQINDYYDRKKRLIEYEKTKGKPPDQK